MADLTFSIKRIRAARVYSDPDPESGGAVRFGPVQSGTRRCVAEMKTFWLCFVAQLVWNNKETTKLYFENVLINFDSSLLFLLPSTWRDRRFFASFFIWPPDKYFYKIFYWPIFKKNLWFSWFSFYMMVIYLCTYSFYNYILTRSRTKTGFHIDVP